MRTFLALAAAASVLSTLACSGAAPTDTIADPQAGPGPRRSDADDPGANGEVVDPPVEPPSDGAGEGGDIGDPSGTGSGTGEPAACDTTKPFGIPSQLGGVNSAAFDTSARLSADELTVFFQRQTSTSWEIYAATRSDMMSPFAGVGLVANVSSTTSNEGGPSATSDGLSLWFHSDRATTTTGNDIYVSRRASTTQMFGAPQRVAALSSTYPDVDPFVKADGSAVYFASKRATTYDLYRGALAANGTASAPTLVAAVNSTTADDSNPIVTADDNTLFFATRRDGGDQDIWMAQRAPGAATFGAPVAVTELDTTGDERPTWISPDGCRLYFSTSARGGAGSSDIFVASRPTH